MSPDHWSKLTWDTVSAGGYDLFDPIGYLDRKRDRAYKQRVIVTPHKEGMKDIISPRVKSWRIHALSHTDLPHALALSKIDLYTQTYKHL